jgi:hypothetical protein
MAILDARGRDRLLGLLACAIALALPGAGLQGRVAVNTGPFPCDGTLRTSRWTNPERTLHLHKASLWAGMTYNGKADYDGSVYRESDGSLVLHFAWDHYGNPSSPHTITQDFSPDWMELRPGDALVLHSWCRRVGGRAAQGHHVLSIWWSDAP